MILRCDWARSYCALLGARVKVGCHIESDVGVENGGTCAGKLFRRRLSRRVARFRARGWSIQAKTGLEWTIRGTYQIRAVTSVGFLFSLARNTIS